MFFDVALTERWNCTFALWSKAHRVPFLAPALMFALFLLGRDIVSLWHVAGMQYTDPLTANVSPRKGLTPQMAEEVGSSGCS